MGLWTKLLGIEVAEGTTFEAAELTFRSYVPWWLATIGILLFAIGIFYLYTREKGTLGWPRRIILTLLRVALLVLVVLLLFRPVLLAEFHGQRPRNIVVLLDNSLSMTQQDSRLTEADKARVAIAKGLLPLDTKLDSIQSAADVPADTPKDPARADIVRWLLKDSKLQLLDNVGKHGPLQPLLFGTKVYGPRQAALIDEGKDAKAKDKPAKKEAAPTGGDDTKSAKKKSDAAAIEDLTKRYLDSFTASEKQTALADVVFEVLQRQQADLPAAMVIISDGQDNASKFALREAGAECARLKVPLHIWGVGTAEGGSLELNGLSAPDAIVVDDPLTVPVRWRAQGFKKGTVQIKLMLAGKEVARKELPLKTGEDLATELTFAAEKGKEEEEKRTLKVEIALKDNEQFRDSLEKQVMVVNRKVKVLIIENSPRFEYKFLQPALLRDRRISPTFLLVKADAKVANSGPPFIPALPSTREKFFDSKYDVIVLGDVSAEYLGAQHLEWIKEFVRKGGGLIVVAGRQHMPASYANTKFEEILPVEFEPVKYSLATETRTQEYQPTLSEVGKRTSMLALADTPEDNLKIWQTLPGFYWQYPITKLRPGALPLVVNPRAKLQIKSKDQPMPLIATQYYGKGQVLYCGTDETWRWRFNVQDKYFVRYWGQIIYQMGEPHLLGKSARRTQFALEHSDAVLDRQGSIFVRLLDKDFNPRVDDKVTAELEYLDARPGQQATQTITLFPVSGRPGDFRALLPHDKPGRFEIRVKNPETKSFQYRVDPPLRHELAKTGMAEKALRDLAAQTEGGFYREEDLRTLAASIQPRNAPFIRRQEIILWNPLAMLLFVLLIGSEWLIRKFSNLS